MAVAHNFHHRFKANYRAAFTFLVQESVGGQLEGRKETAMFRSRAGDGIYGWLRKCIGAYVEYQIDL